MEDKNNKEIGFVPSYVAHLRYNNPVVQSVSDIIVTYSFADGYKNNWLYMKNFGLVQ